MDRRPRHPLPRVPGGDAWRRRPVRPAARAARPGAAGGERGGGTIGRRGGGGRSPAWPGRDRRAGGVRTAFLLHDVFGLGHDEIAGVVGRPVARRSANSPHGRAGGCTTTTPVHRRPAPSRPARSIGSCWTRSRRRALRGDLERLMALLDPDVVWRADGGAVRAEPRMAEGARHIATLVASYAQRPPRRMLKALVNGDPGWSYGTRTACSRRNWAGPPTCWTRTCFSRPCLAARV